MLVHIKELFAKPIVGKLAIPAFNTQNLETTLAIITAAEEAQCPIIIQTSEGVVEYAGLETIFEIIATVAHRSKTPVVLHFDHGKNVELLEKAITLGYSSVMIDHSIMDPSTNIADTKSMVGFAHARGAWVQAEIGKIQGAEDWLKVGENEATFTTPVEALDFVTQTGCDTFAPSVGTVHGINKLLSQTKPHLNLPLIKEIYDTVKKPLVLHGASGVSPEDVSVAIAGGVAIINIDSELRKSFHDALVNQITITPDEADVRKIMKPVMSMVKETVKRKLQEFRTAEWNTL